MTQIETAGQSGSEHARADSRVRFETLDSWRGICALLVAMMHFPASGLLSDNPLVRNAFLFVDYFFVLSGFVIAHGYAHRLVKGADYARFLVLRIGRIYPLHVAVLALFVGFEALRWAVPALQGDGAAPFSDGHTPMQLLRSLALLNGLGIEHGLTWNGPSWSISTEMWTYVVFGLAVVVLGRRFPLVLAPAILAGPVVLYLWSPVYMDATWHLGFVRCLYGFSVGALLYRLSASDLLKRRAQAVTDADRALRWTAFEIGAVIAAVVFVAAFADGPLGIAAPFVFALVLWVFAVEGGVVSRLLKRPAFLWLGALSYGIYMVHIFVQSRMINVATLAEKLTGLDLVGEFAIGGERFHGFGVSGAAFGTLAMIVMVAAVLTTALAMHFLVERPFQRMARNLARRFDVRPTAQAADTLDTGSEPVLRRGRLPVGD